MKAESLNYSKFASSTRTLSPMALRFSQRSTAARCRSRTAVRTSTCPKTACPPVTKTCLNWETRALINSCEIILLSVLAGRKCACLMVLVCEMSVRCQVNVWSEEIVLQLLSQSNVLRSKSSIFKKLLQIKLTLIIIFCVVSYFVTLWLVMFIF